MRARTEPRSSLPLGVILVPIALFAVFCEAWELERLARTRLDPFRD